MKIGFTGTQFGMSKNQKKEFEDFLNRNYVSNSEFHHGCCIGADTEAFNIIRKFAFKIIAHPPTNKKKVSPFTILYSDEVRDDKEYLDRNHDIVDESNILIAAPKSNKEELRSGTWATIRYAIKMKKEVIILNRYEKNKNATIK
jgi:hypothetical protein